MMVSNSPLTPLLIAEQAHMTNEQVAPIDADALLQASRRVDWRFLLPDPNLGRVAYCGPAHGTLLESLRLFSESLTVIEKVADVDAAQYDLVVMSGPSSEMLRWSAELIRPGGFLYVEAYGPFQRGRPRRGDRRLRYATDYLTAIERIGLVEAAAHWHWPDFETCAEILPLADQDALLLAFARRRSGVGARLKSALGRALLRGGLFARVTPCFSIVAWKPD